MRAMTRNAPGARIDRWARMALAVLGVALAAACASSKPHPIPPVTETPTGLVTPGKFVWVDLVTDAAKLLNAILDSSDLSDADLRNANLFQAHLVFNSATFSWSSANSGLSPAIGAIIS